MSHPYFWTNHEQRRAKQLREEGLSYDKISHFVGRSKNAVAAHLRSLRLSEARQMSGEE